MRSTLTSAHSLPSNCNCFTYRCQFAVLSICSVKPLQHLQFGEQVGKNTDVCIPAKAAIPSGNTKYDLSCCIEYNKLVKFVQSKVIFPARILCSPSNFKESCMYVLWLQCLVVRIHRMPWNIQWQIWRWRSATISYSLRSLFFLIRCEFVGTH